MSLTDAPTIITARAGAPDSFTLDRAVATGGYEGLRKALKMTPEAVCAEVDEASLLGRGGAVQHLVRSLDVVCDVVVAGNPLTRA